MDFNKIDEEMKKYNSMHKADIHLNDFEKGDPVLANFIYDNFDKMNEQEMRIIANKCLEFNRVREIVLSYELKYHKINNPVKMTLNEFKKYAKIILNRYQWKAGGYLIEDREWRVYDSKSAKYDIKKNELVFENTRCLVDVNDCDTIEFMNNICKKLDGITLNIHIEWRNKQNYESKYINLLIWAVDKDSNDDDVVITL